MKELVERVYIESKDDLPKENGIYFAFHKDVHLDEWIGSDILFELSLRQTWVDWETQVKWYINKKVKPYGYFI